ncbi:uncharacterized protein LOC134240904 [Saccostrea cucullata]|uniref:uncharacterized protein LOC134240904 n=1 Tax=Saccostrea cuccullata TaxID=36930 RepID=UPI002ED1F5B7
MCNFVLDCIKTRRDVKSYVELSSMDSLFEYVNVRQHYGKEGKCCLYVPGNLLIGRLGINVIVHETFQSESKAVCRKLKIPDNVGNLDHRTRIRFHRYVKTSVEKDPLPAGELSFNSLLGSFLIEETTDMIKDLKSLHLSIKKWSILISILLSTDYCLCIYTNWKEKLEEIRNAFSTLQDDDTNEENEAMGEFLSKDFVLKEDKDKESVKFLSNEVRHQDLFYVLQLWNKGGIMIGVDGGQHLENPSYCD